MSDWSDNHGTMPGMVSGRRVLVELRNGMKPPESWPADGRGCCRWVLDGSPFDIVKFHAL